MISSPQRLTTAIFKDIFLTGKSFHSTSFIVRAKKNGVKKSRFGVSVTKKVSPTAVGRNKITRRIYTALRSIPLSSPVHAIFIVNKSAISMTPKEFEVELREVFGKMGLLK